MLTSVFRLTSWWWLCISLTLLTPAAVAQPAVYQDRGAAKSKGADALKELELVVRGRLFTHFHYTQMEPEPFNEFEIREIQFFGCDVAVFRCHGNTRVGTMSCIGLGTPKLSGLRHPRTGWCVACKLRVQRSQ